MSSPGIMRLIIIFLAAYMIGNINPAIILGKIRGIDIRKEGSGNAGMTNTIRVMGLGAGITVFVVDVLKGFVAVTLGYSLGSTYGAMAAFAGVVLGHCFPAVFGFKGGKGVLTSLAMAFMLDWRASVIALVVFVIVLLITRYVSVSSLTATFVDVMLIFFFNMNNPISYVAGFLAGILIFVKHKANIIRLINKTESKIF